MNPTDTTPLGADAFFETIRVSTLQAGGHPTTVLVVGSADRVVLTFGDWPARSEEDNQQLVYQAGADLARKGQIGTLVQLGFVSEALVTGIGQRDAPSPGGVTPAPQDMLLLTLRTLEPRDDATAIFRMVRSSDDTLIVHQGLPHPADGLVQSRWLDTFMAGFAAGTRKEAGTS